MGGAVLHEVTRDFVRTGQTAIDPRENALRAGRPGLQAKQDATADAFLRHQLHARFA